VKLRFTRHSSHLFYLRYADKFTFCPVFYMSTQHITIFFSTNNNIGVLINSPHVCLSSQDKLLFPILLFPMVVSRRTEDQNDEVRVFLVYRVGPGIYTGKPAETLQQNVA
jgi:hypothetical protein